MGDDKLSVQLDRYADYHQDRRNILTHLFGIPIIMLALMILLSRPGFGIGPLTLTPAGALTTVLSLYYLIQDLRLGAVLATWLLISLAVASYLAGRSTAMWLACGLILFCFGWLLQFIGHYFEGRKPAFMDDLRSLLTGPAFVARELLILAEKDRDKHPEG